MPFNNTVSLRELWGGFNPDGVLKGTFMLFRGYIDESYDNARRTFALACVTAKGSKWLEIERQWKLHLAAVNRKLKKQGRSPISRYHASDCSGRRQEFKGWSHTERDDFVRGLFVVLKRCPVYTVGIDMNLDDLCDVFPEWEDKRIKAAYYIFTKFLLNTIGSDYHIFHQSISPPKITLFHDRTLDYDTTILQSFNETINSDFEHASSFTSITPLGWEDCIALQLADLIAFEVFKAAEAREAARANRKSFEALLDLNAFGIHTQTFAKDAMLDYRAMLAEQGMLQNIICWGK